MYPSLCLRLTASLLVGCVDWKCILSVLELTALIRYSDSVFSSTFELTIRVKYALSDRIPIMDIVNKRNILYLIDIPIFFMLDLLLTCNPFHVLYGLIYVHNHYLFFVLNNVCKRQQH